MGGCDSRGGQLGQIKDRLVLDLKLHLLSHFDGHIRGGLLLPANFNDRDAAPALALSVDGGVALGDWDT